MALVQVSDGGGLARQWQWEWHGDTSLGSRHNFHILLKEGSRLEEVGREEGRNGEIRDDGQVGGSFFPSQEKSSGKFWPQADGETRRRLRAT